MSRHLEKVSRLEKKAQGVDGDYGEATDYNRDAPLPEVSARHMKGTLTAHPSDCT